MSFDEKTILAVWEKGTIAKGWEATMWRKDACGAWIKFDAYGDRESQCSNSSMGAKRQIFKTMRALPQ